MHSLSGILFSSHFQIKELRKIQTKGGVRLGESNPTWCKQGQSDVITNYIGLGLCLLGFYQLATGHYKLATGKGKMD